MINNFFPQLTIIMTTIPIFDTHLLGLSKKISHFQINIIFLYYYKVRLFKEEVMFSSLFDPEIDIYIYIY